MNSLANGHRHASFAQAMRFSYNCTDYRLTEPMIFLVHFVETEARRMRYNEAKEQQEIYEAQNRFSKQNNAG